MDVDCTNFTASFLSELELLISESSFISLDLEMTGITGPSDAQRAASSSDSIPLRYSKSRLVARQFGIIQFGLSLFRGSLFAGTVEARTFNFYIFPRPVAEGGGVRYMPVVGLCSSGINFSRQTKMDFQRWIDRGVPFVDAATEERLLSGEGEETGDAWSKYFSGTPVEAVFAERPDLYDHKPPSDVGFQ